MSEGAVDFLAIALLGVIVCLVLYIIWLRIGLKKDTKKDTKKVKTDTKKADTKKKVDTSQAKLPPVVYFSTTAVGNQRSFHASETCRALKRVPSVCHAVACKVCVDKED